MTQPKIFVQALPLPEGIASCVLRLPFQQFEPHCAWTGPKVPMASKQHQDPHHPWPCMAKWALNYTSSCLSLRTPDDEQGTRLLPLTLL